jgi:hypothetical protein
MISTKGKIVRLLLIDAAAFWTISAAASPSPAFWQE